MKPRNLILALICLTTAGSLMAVSKADHEVSLESVVELWADIVRDVDRFGVTITRVSVKREMEIGREIERRIARYRRLNTDPGLQAYVTRVGQPLLEHVQRKAIRYRFYIVDSPMINAYAVPGGGIYITTGMIGFLQSEAELAAILGHEISHVDLKHCIERLQYELAARKAVGNDLAKIAGIGYKVVSLGFNEQQELEADASGVILAAKAGYHPQAGISVFQRLAKVKWQRGRREHRKKSTFMVQELGTAVHKALEQYFATHPLTEKRVRQLEQVLKRNAPAWRGEKFYVGRTNYYDRIARSTNKRTEELILFSADGEVVWN